MVFNCREVTEVKSSKNKTSNPENSAKDVVTDKAEVVHLTDACDEGRKGSDDGDKSRKYDCFPSMFFIELVGTIQVIYVQPSHIFLLEYFGPDNGAKPIINSISQECCD